MLHGDRVVLRAIEEADLSFLWEMRNDLELETFTSNDPPAPVSLAQLENWFEDEVASPPADAALFTIEVDGEPVGRCDLFEIDEYGRTARLGMTIAKQHWGHGYAKDAVRVLVDFAFTHRNLRRVWLDVLEDNDRAIAVYKACGFVEEGRLRKHTFHEGAYKDLVVMGILREQT